LPAYPRHLRISLMILSTLLIVTMVAVPREAGAANPFKKPTSVPVNLLIDYGNGTLVWNNGTVVPSSWNFYNVTSLDTNNNLGSIFFASFGSHFVYQINGVGCPSTTPFCNNSWGLWILQGSCWILASSGIDQIPVAYHATVGWYLVPGSTLGETPPTGANCTSVNIDVKPPSDPATINPIAKGTIQAVILSTSTFNASSQVLTSSLTFGETGTERSLAYCNSSTQAGLTDLVCKFDTQLAGFHPGDTLAILNGLTKDGTPIVGTDTVVVL
jgi:hypothetical protein